MLKEKSTKPKEKEIIESETQEGKENKKREIVVPGEVLVKGLGFLPGDGTFREGEEIKASRFGLLDKSGRLVKVIAISGRYTPRAGDIVIGEITDIVMQGWLLDIGATNNAFLGIVEGSREFIERGADLRRYHKVGEVISAKIISCNNKSIDLTIKGPGLRKLDVNEGLIMEVNTHKVPRIIGKSGSMVNIIKQETDCNITIGQNGVIWIRGNDIDSELLARDAINLVAEFAHTNELTERVENFLKNSKKSKPKPKPKEKEKSKEKPEESKPKEEMKSE